MDKKVKELLQHVRSLHVDEIFDIDNSFFGKINNGYEYRVVDKWNHGDGNEIGIILYFETLNTYIRLKGTFSSWDESEWYPRKSSIVYPHRVVRTAWESDTQTLEQLEGERDKLK